MQKEAEKFASSNLLEGKVSLRALLDARTEGHNDRPIERILFAREKLKSKERDYRYFSARGREQGYEVELVPLADLDAMAIGNTHGGILAVCGDRTFPVIDEAILREKPRGFFVLLDGVEDPYNFGYALRSLYAAGVDAILLSPRNWMGAAGVVCRASAGASERFQMYLCPDDVIDLFHRCGYRVLCADIDNSVSVYDADLSFPLLLVVGGEKRGIAAQTLSQADEIVRLEYGRPFPCALSTASAATLLAYEIYRYNR